MKTLILCDHPSFDQSIVNRRWIDEVKKYPDEFLIHNLQSSYPRGLIDRSREHSLMDNNGPIVFQFPMHWFSSPPLLKLWCDKVLTEDWAYGKEYHLQGKRIAMAVTCGAPEQHYTHDGEVGKTIEELLVSIIETIRYCKADFGGIFAFYGASDQIHKENISSVSVSARNYIDFLRGLSGTPGTGTGTASPA